MVKSSTRNLNSLKLMLLSPSESNLRMISSMPSTIPNLAHSSLNSSSSSFPDLSLSYFSKRVRAMRASGSTSSYTAGARDDEGMGIVDVDDATRAHLSRRGHSSIMNLMTAMYAVIFDLAAAMSVICGGGVIRVGPKTIARFCAVIWLNSRRSYTRERWSRMYAVVGLLSSGSSSNSAMKARFFSAVSAIFSASSHLSCSLDVNRGSGRRRKKFLSRLVILCMSSPFRRLTTTSVANSDAIFLTFSFDPERRYTPTSLIPRCFTWSMHAVTTFGTCVFSLRSSCGRLSPNMGRPVSYTMRTSTFPLGDIPVLWCRSTTRVRGLPSASVSRSMLPSPQGLDAPIFSWSRQRICKIRASVTLMSNVSNQSGDRVRYLAAVRHLTTNGYVCLSSTRIMQNGSDDLPPLSQPRMSIPRSTWMLSRPVIAWGVPSFSF
eukprot:Opistho-2@21975